MLDGRPLPSGKLPLFGGLDGARFRRQVGPGDELHAGGRARAHVERAGKGSGRALLQGVVACSCDLLFVVVDTLTVRRDRVTTIDLYGDGEGRVQAGVMTTDPLCPPKPKLLEIVGPGLPIVGVAGDDVDAEVVDDLRCWAVGGIARFWNDSNTAAASSAPAAPRA